MTIIGEAASRATQNPCGVVQASDKRGAALELLLLRSNRWHAMKQKHEMKTGAHLPHLIQSESVVCLLEFTAAQVRIHTEQLRACTGCCWATYYNSALISGMLIK